MDDMIQEDKFLYSPFSFMTWVKARRAYLLNLQATLDGTANILEDRKPIEVSLDTLEKKGLKSKREQCKLLHLGSQKLNVQVQNGLKV